MAPDWLEPVYTADEMRALDAWAIEDCGVPSLDLMERAGGEVARAVTALSPKGAVRVVCGKGNNGGDGLVVARVLEELGLPVAALLLFPGDSLTGDPQVNLERLRKIGGEAREVSPDDLPDALANSSVIVDALLGTGFAGSPRAPLDAAIEAVNGAGAEVVAVDVPSGVDASSGEVAGACVRADLTVTFHGPKVGLWVNPGKAHAGRVEVVEIGIPSEGQKPPAAGLIGMDVLELLPHRGSDSNKFASGSVLVVGGSTGLTGAVCLACEGAMRAGAGWVRAAVPASLNAIFEVKLTEVMSVPLPDRDGHLLASAADEVLEAAERADSVVLGPGLGRTDESFELARALIERIDRPLLVDADALNAIAADGAKGFERAAARAAPLVLTPHAGELARLLGTSSGEVAAHRLSSVRQAAARADATVVLKGDDTLVAAAGGAAGRLAISKGGSPGLATAGTGDVLSGVTAAFLARLGDPFEAASAAVRAHADAGRGAARRLGADSVMAHDVIDALPGALNGPRGAA
jgi:ADP-dependent NAD(P)H-hydrate dehydratase / NAD(P)H-hydrate epimerase